MSQKCQLQLGQVKGQIVGKFVTFEPSSNVLVQFYPGWAAGSRPTFAFNYISTFLFFLRNWNPNFSTMKFIVLQLFPLPFSQPRFAPGLEYDPSAANTPTNSERQYCGLSSTQMLTCKVVVSIELVGPTLHVISFSALIQIWLHTHKSKKLKPLTSEDILELEMTCASYEFWHNK